MKRLVVSVLALFAMTDLASAGYRDRGRTAYFGPDCRSVQRATGQATVVVGTVLGGQNRRGRWGDGTNRDYRTFQACFATVEACVDWAGRQQAHHPHPPGYARCTPIFVGLLPPGESPRASIVRARY